MVRDREYWRSCYPSELLIHARENGIDPEMAIVLAEQLESLLETHDWDESVSAFSGGRYTFNHRSTT